MSDKEALKIFSRQPVSNDMIQFLALTTSSIIQVKTPCATSKLSSSLLVTPVGKHSVSLVNFIKKLIRYSNVQTPTLMATLTYLNKLRNLLPANAIGMETTRHRIFLAALILSAKSLNDSSPLNKHWTKYTDGLLTLDEVNMAERELINLLNWNILIKQDELIVALQPFLTPIKHSLIKSYEDDALRKMNYYRLSNSYSNKSISPINSSSSISSLSSTHSNLSLSRSTSSQYNLCDATPDFKVKRKPLASKSQNSLNLSRYNDKFDSNVNLMHSGRIIT